jgi:hypothetical protein
MDVGAEQHGLARLEDLVLGGGANGLEVLPLVERLGLGGGALEDVVGGAEGGGVVEEVLEQLDDPAEGAVAGEDQAEDPLRTPLLVLPGFEPCLFSASFCAASSDAERR